MSEKQHVKVVYEHLYATLIALNESNPEFKRAWRDM